MKINVTRSFMPPIEEYTNYINKIWENRYLTNEGPLLQELVEKLKGYLQVEHINMVNNGTTALELAIRALDLHDCEIITTPFSFVATTSSIIWERCTPVFVDIDEKDLCIDVNKIEQAITPRTKAIMAVHVFGYPCDVYAIEKIAKKHDLKVIYDGAHAFGSKYDGRSLLSYGDIATCSFHATKLFHTIEGGACFTKDSLVNEKISYLKKFGEVDKEYKFVGTNAKMTEFNAAMGLANFKYINDIIKERKEICELYDKELVGFVERPIVRDGTEQNYIYYPILLKDEETTLKIIDKLISNDINPRRYFYPALNTLNFLERSIKCPVCEDITKRIICLPLYNGLKKDDIEKISKIIKEFI